MIKVQDTLAQKIIIEARSWVKTPHKHNQALKGIDGGADCIRFPLEVAKSCGIKIIDPGNYERDPQDEKLLNRLDEQLYLVGVVREARNNWSTKYFARSTSRKQLILLSKPGDILVYKRTFKGDPGHVALKLEDDSIIQCFNKTGVQETHIGTAPLLCAVYRFHELLELERCG